MLRKIFILTFILTLSKSLFALTLEEKIAINKDRGNGARVLGMGRAFTAIADDATAIFFNPAGILQVNGQFFDGGYSFDNEKNFNNWHLAIVNSSHSQGEAGALGFYGKKYNLPFDETQEYVGLVSIAQPYGRNFFLGGSAKYIKIDNEIQEDESGFSFDIGVLIKLQEYLSFGVMGYDLGKPQISTHPRKVRMGIGLTFRPNILIDFDVDHFTQKDIRDLDYHYGIEILPGQTISIQVGYFTEKINSSEIATGGFTFRLPKTGRTDYISYSYSEELKEGIDKNIEKIHSISVGVNL